MQQKIVLLTGCSSGIGRALAQAFHARGHIVYASARRPETLQALADEGMHTLALDVCRQADIDAAIATIRAAHGRLDIVVNNAGYGQFGAAADLDMATLERQFGVNVFAPVQVVRAALPLLCAARGLVINVGSVSGVMTTPFAGAYCASKAALHAISEALRMEMAPFGVRVMVVQPGAIASPFGDNGMANVCLPADSLFQSMRKAVLARANASQKKAAPASEFAAALAEAALRETPPRLFRYGPQSRLLPFLARWVPCARRERMLAKKFGLDRRADQAV